MGKKTKEHRKKVAKRNQRISEEKTKVQRQFNKLLKEEMDKLQQNEELNIQMGDKPLNFEFVDGQEEQTTEISVTNEESVNE
jgi:hypothetical protein